MAAASPRWLQRLDAAVAEAATPLARECAKADRAVRLARMGRLDDARFALTGLRSQQQRLRAPPLEARIVFLAGMIAHFTSLSPEARTHFAQARALAEQAGEAPLAALAAAWAAQCLLNDSDIAGMAAQMRFVIDHAGAHDHATWARLALALCVGFDYAGDLPASQRWATLARQHASQDDDSSMISAVLYNMASLRASRIAFDDAWGRSELDDARRALMEVESTGHYDFGAGSAGLGALVPTMRALLLSVLGRCDEAAVLFERHIEPIRQQGHAAIAGRYLAEWAWCEARMGHLDRARRMGQRAEQALAPCGARADGARTDDAHTAAATLARLAQLMDCCGKAEAADHRRRADAALADWHQYQQQMQAALGSLPLPATATPASA